MMEKMKFDKLKLFSLSSSFIGFLVFALGLFLDAKRIWFSYLTSSLFVLFLSLGALFFISIHHISKASWSVNIRRLMEGFLAYLPIGIILIFPLLFSEQALYSWFDPEIVAKDKILIKKAPYLNWTFFFLRLVIYASIWLFFAFRFLKFSFKLDETGDEKWSLKSLNHSPPFLILFALSFTFFSIDVLMSLEPHWFSTIFSVYTFTGLFQSFIAALILLIIFFKRKGLLPDHLVNQNHLHDLGKYLLGLCIFWAYIGFSQYMLIWYANLPEEAGYYLHRSGGPFMWLSLLLILFKFVVPFLFLLPRWVKRDQNALIVICIIVLVAQYFDIYWLTYPQFDSHHIYFSWMELGMLLGFIGLFLYPVLSFFERHPLVPKKDPKSSQSSSHVVTY